MVRHRMSGLYLSLVFPYNQELLRRLNFECIDESFSIFRMTRERLAELRPEDWSVRKTFPSAAWLNSDECVNGSGTA